jgi:hypothetical protein|tara:strand:- start:6227 stop:6553 length:327 start_codon:yes stop_codon:yes gene_type:complete
MATLTDSNIKKLQNKGPYGKTPVNSAGYLDIMTARPVPVGLDDILYEITPAYTYRPDLLANDLYAAKDLWWIFAQRNPDVIKDPVFDFVAGTKIYLPQRKHLKNILGV